jgi:hypothetical protein
MELNNTKKEIINHLIAAHDGRPWGSKLSKYFRAFTGAFSPDMPFTFYFLTETRPIMYVYDPLPGNLRSSRTVFHGECEQKKPKILEITSFFEYLVTNGYLNMEYKGLQRRPPLPDHYDRIWRKYSDFYNDIMLGLSYICLSDFTPTQHLYDFWETSIQTSRVLCL